MQSESFLSNEDHEAVTAVGSMLTKSDKAVIMVNSLISKVKIKSDNYQKFLKLIQTQQRKFSDVVDLLSSSESNIG